MQSSSSDFTVGGMARDERFSCLRIICADDQHVEMRTPSHADLVDLKSKRQTNRDCAIGALVRSFW